MTVSRALNNRANVTKKTRRRVLDMAHNMGYTPNHIAKSLVSSKTYTIGVVIPEISHSFFPEVVRGIEEVTNNSDYQLFLTNSDEQFEREMEAIRTLLSKRVDGILVSSCQTAADFSFYKQMISRGSRIVFFDRCIENIGASCVSVNDRHSSEQITNHLIEHHEYKKIGYLSGPQKISIGKRRLQGYLDALKAHHLPVEKKWIQQAGFQEERGYAAMKKLLDLPKGELPRAIVAVNDPCAIGAIKAIGEHSLSIPEDIAIVGFTDDVRAPLLETPLTTVHQPAYKVGKRAVQKLLQSIEHEQEPVENIQIITTLKIRASCGCE